MTGEADASHPPIPMLAGLLLVLPAMSQQPAPQSMQAPPPSTSTSAATPTPPTLSDADQDKLRELTDRVRKLELELSQQSKRSTNSALTNALIAAFALLGASWIAGKWAAERARQEAVYRQTERIVEYRLKQMEHFYAPMFALLGQSKALYRRCPAFRWRLSGGSQARFV